MSDALAPTEPAEVITYNRSDFETAAEVLRGFAFAVRQVGPLVERLEALGAPRMVRRALEGGWALLEGAAFEHAERCEKVAQALEWEAQKR